MEFLTAYSKKPRPKSEAGTKVELKHRPVMRKDGTRELVKDKKNPTYENIQMHREGCEIENILRRHGMGDTTALNKVIGQYMDVTGMPKTIAEAQQLVINLREHFNELPKEVRAKFEFNVEKYVAQYGTEEWLEKTGIKTKMTTDAVGKQIQTTKEVKEEVKENE